MRYKSLLQDKLISVSNGLKQLRGQMERGERTEFRDKEEQLQELLEDIQTLINTQTEQH